MSSIQPYTPQELSQFVIAPVVGSMAVGILSYKIASVASERFKALKGFETGVCVATTLITLWVFYTHPPVANRVSTAASAVLLSLQLAKVHEFVSASSRPSTELPEFITDLTKLDPDAPPRDYGHIDEYIEKLELLLNRSQKNNAILVGPSGCGKTVIVEALAAKIISGTLPAHSRFRNRKIFSISLNSFLSNIKYLGQIQEKVAELERVAKAHKDAIFFMDEIHLLVGGGQGVHSHADVANLLKPALARNGISLIGATTEKEYAIVQQDGAFERRFSRMDIKSPNLTQSYQMLLAQRSFFEKTYPKVSITESAAAMAAYLAKTKHAEKSTIDTASDLLDTTCSEKDYKRSFDFSLSDTVDAEVVVEMYLTLYARNNNPAPLKETIMAAYNLFRQTYPNYLQY